MSLRGAAATCVSNGSGQQILSVTRSRRWVGLFPSAGLRHHEHGELQRSNLRQRTGRCASNVAGDTDSSRAASSVGGLGQTGATFGGAGIIGVSPASAKQSITMYRKKNHYDRWEFTYDPLGDMTLVNGNPVTDQPPATSVIGIGSGPQGTGPTPSPGPSSQETTPQPQWYRIEAVNQCTLCRRFLAPPPDKRLLVGLFFTNSGIGRMRVKAHISLSLRDRARTKPQVLLYQPSSPGFLLVQSK